MWLYGVLHNHEVGPCICVVDESYWNRHRCLNSGFIGYFIGLSGSFEEIEESTFVFDGTEDEMLRELITYELEGDFKRDTTLEAFINCGHS